MGTPFDQWAVRIARTAGAEPTWDVDHEKRVVTLTYDGNVAELVLAAIAAGQEIPLGDDEE